MFIQKKITIFAYENLKVHSSSGPGHQILSLRIAGSNPACGTNYANARSIN